MFTSFSRDIYVFDGKLTVLSIFLKTRVVLIYVAPPQENYVITIGVNSQTSKSVTTHRRYWVLDVRLSIVSVKFYAILK